MMHPALVGIFDRLAVALDINARATTSARSPRIASPWSQGNSLAAIQTAMFGETYAPMTRAEAMRVPAMAKARAIITGTLAKQPLGLYDNGTPVTPLPRWMQATNTELPVWHRMAWTLDDLIFSGWSLWVKDGAGYDFDAMRVPFDLWQFNAFGGIEISVNGDWVPVRGDEVILFVGPQEGMLDLAADTLRGARAVEKTILDRARTPYSAIDIKQTDGTALEPEEIDDLIEDFIASRRDHDGSSIGYVPGGIELEYHGEKPEMLIEARNAYRLDVAAFANLPGQILDASLSTASLTYSTQEGRRNELLDYSLGYWADPIASRLSQDDVVEPGLSVRFDMTDFVALITNPAAPTTED